MAERDPLARDIRRCLAEKLNPKKFEQCACDLLRPEYPGLALVSGGSDGGMDGAIPSSGGPPLPLVCTTAEDVIGNLTKNLKSYMNDGGTAREVVVATSQSLTHRRRRNLEKRASEHEFTMRNIHDREDFVTYLYYSPRWCLELLGLTHDPPALSRFSMRGQRISRETLEREEINWLRETADDFLLVGQPGIGKASWLEVLADDKRGLFVVRDDIDRIVSDYRAERPEYILVEDAHLRLDLLKELCRLRLDPGALFKVGATAWPADAADVKRVVEKWQVADSPTKMAVLRLRGLPRETVAEIVRSVVSDRFSDEVVAEILNQSAYESNEPLAPVYDMPISSPGKPGLALTLAERVARSGDIRRLVTGQNLLALVSETYDLGIKALDVLAVFALGGRSGVSLADVSKVLNHSGADVREHILPLSGTGILNECGWVDSPSYLRESQPIRVEPAALREALVQRTFFSGGMSLGVERAIEFVEDQHDATSTLIRVLARGGCVPHELIRDRLRDDVVTARSGDLWQEYARTGREAVCWILEEHPQFSEFVASPALAAASEKALPILLKTADDRNRPGRAGLAAIREWLMRFDAAIIGRRAQVLDELIRLSREESLDQKKLALMNCVFSPTFESIQLNQVSVEQLIIVSGTLPVTNIEELAGLWPRALPVLDRAGDVGVSVAQGIAQSWTRDAHRAHEGSVRASDVVRHHAATLVSDVVELAGQGPGIRLWAAHLAESTNLPLEFSTADPVFDALFPPWSGDSDSKQRDQVVASLVEAMVRNDVKEGVEKILRYERERTRSEQIVAISNGLLPVVAGVAERTSKPAAWVEALVARKAPAGWFHPFAKRMLVPSSGVPAQAWQLFREEPYAAVLVEVGICYADPTTDDGRPSAVVRHVMEHATDACFLLRELICWPDVADGWKVLLMTHEYPAVRGAVAEGVFRWYERRGDPALSALSPIALSAWHQAILVCVDYMVLGRVFRQFPDVAQAWLLDREDAAFAADEPDAPLDQETFDPNAVAKELVRRLETPSIDRSVFDEAVSVLTTDQRRELIRALPKTTDPLAVDALVGTSLDLYRTLLSRRQLRRFHLHPLKRMPISSDLPDFVLAAMDQGKAETELIGHIGVLAWHDGARGAMEKWKEHEDDRIRRLARTWLGLLRRSAASE